MTASGAALPAEKWQRRPTSEIGRTTQAVLGGALVMALAAFLSFNRLGEVKAPIWDEAYYLTSTARYHEGRMQFASHPPLGLMLIAAGDRLSGLNQNTDWRGMAAMKSIKAVMVPAGFDYRGPRIASALAATIAAGLFYLLMLGLTGSPSCALLLAPLFLCDTALFAQFRAAQLDSFQLAFALAAFNCAIRGWRSAGPGWAIGFGFCVACAALVRANGILLAPVGLFLIWSALRQRHWGRVLAGIAGGTSAATLALALVAMAHVVASPLPPDPATEAGRADLRLAPVSLTVAAIIPAYAGYIASDHEGMTRTDDNASHPAEWLIGKGSITYRWDAGAGKVATIGMIPNYAAWLVSLFGVLAALWKSWSGLSAERAMLLTAWLVNMAALQWLDGERVLYLYHYFLPLLLGHALAAIAWRDSGFRERSAQVALAAVTMAFVVAAPLAFHHSVPKAYCAAFLPDCGL